MYTLFLRRSLLFPALSCLVLAACSILNTDVNKDSIRGPVLQLQLDAQIKNLSQSELLHSRLVQSIVIPDDASYHRQQTYMAVPLWSLVGSLPSQGNLQFTALDGFVATIPNQLITNDANAAQAWLAIEDPAHPWDALKPGQPSAGPFYLVWLAPEKSHISGEQWPYQIAKIAVTTPLEVRYPQLLPHAEGELQLTALRGLQVFTKNCATCHSLNDGGDAKIGPDLNLPMNPSEYFQEAALRHLIREPGSVRRWSQSVMPGFKADIVSDNELDDLLVYLRQMAAQRNGLSVR
ncbi:cytochrome c [Undibacterium jejuense]|uniref:Cytochrome c n=1 Tax=Undibacterium jejuense TaxID=1344949 RepID=A0A923HRR3_9BURK|nr:cytochrome c [Undibacterium jejuense]MBC3863513.1 cytochrome c [Undibacterium jejuense]